MAKMQAWERFDDSLDGLEAPAADYSEYVATTWDGGQATAIIVANENGDRLQVLDPEDWIGRAATQRTVSR